MVASMHEEECVSTLVLAEIFLPRIGGSVNWILNTYSRYPPGKVVVVSPKINQDDSVVPSLPFPVERLPIRFSSLEPFSSILFSEFLPAFQSVRRWCRRYGIQQIHCAKVLPEGVIAWVLKTVYGIPYLVYAHGEEILIGQTSRKMAWLMPKIYNHASGIIVNSQNTKRLLIGIGVRGEHIHVIHPGVDFHAIRKGAVHRDRIRKEHRLEDCRVLLVVGRLQRRKGHDMLIRALPIIRKRFSNTKCVFVGTGEEERYLKEVVHEAGMEEHVIFAGRIPDAELGGYYDCSDIFVMPNRQIGEDIEGFGMVYLEAGAVAKPVIGGKSGGTDDAILDGVTGILVDGNDVGEIVKAVVSLLEFPEKAEKMGENGRRRVEEEFSWDTVFQKTWELADTISPK